MLVIERLKTLWKGRRAVRLLPRPVPQNSALQDFPLFICAGSNRTYIAQGLFETRSANAIQENGVPRGPKQKRQRDAGVTDAGRKITRNG